MSIDVMSDRTSSLTERVAEEIRALMARKRVRQSHLARELGVSEQWISVRMRGVQPIDLNDLDRIARALGVSIIDLIPAGDRKRTAGGDGDENVRTTAYLSSGRRPHDHRPNGHAPGTTRPEGAPRPVRLTPPIAA
jgi:transcriptional regulator with XRE-family HTH domain